MIIIVLYSFYKWYLIITKIYLPYQCHSVTYITDGVSETQRKSSTTAFNNLTYFRRELIVTSTRTPQRTNHAIQHFSAPFDNAVNFIFLILLNGSNIVSERAKYSNYQSRIELVHELLLGEVQQPLDIPRGIRPHERTGRRIQLKLLHT